MFIPISLALSTLLYLCDALIFICVVLRASSSVDDIFMLGFMYVSFFRLGYFIVAFVIPSECCHSSDREGEELNSTMKSCCVLLLPIINAIVIYILLNSKYEDFFLLDSYFEFDFSPYMFMFAIGV